MGPRACIGDIEVIATALDTKGSVGFNVIAEFTRFADEFSGVECLSPCACLFIGWVHAVGKSPCPIMQTVSKMVLIHLCWLSAVGSVSTDPLQAF